MMWTKELRRHRGRTAATATAVAIAMALLVSMLSISNGIISTVESQIVDSQADIQVAAPYDTDFPGGHTIAANLSGWPEVEFATPVLRSLVSVTSGKPLTSSITPVALGVVPGEFYRVLPQRDQALIDHWFTTLDDTHFASSYAGAWSDEVVLSTQLAENLSVAAGDTVVVKGAPSAPEHTFRVVGTADTELSPDRVIQDVRFAFFKLSELQELTLGARLADANGTREVDAANRLYVSLDASVRLQPDGARSVQQKIEAAYPDFAGMVTTKQDRLAKLQDEYSVGRIFYTAIGFVSLVIGLLFVGCIVTISVSERTRDIGALRAIGVSRRSIFTMVLAEALVLVAAGALAGILPAYLAASALGHFVASSQGVAPTFIAFDAPLVLASLARVVLFGAAVSLYPAWKATRIPVVDALHARG